MREPIFETLFGSGDRVRILRWFLNHPEEGADGLIISKVLKIRKQVVSKEIKNLKKINFLVGVGKKLFLNNNFPLLSVLKNFILRPEPDFYVSLANDFKSVKGIKLLLLGGFFKGEDEGVLDVLIVADKINSSWVNKEIAKIEKQLGREIKYTLISSSEFNYRYSMFDKFIKNILEGSRIILINRLKDFSWL